MSDQPERRTIEGSWLPSAGPSESGDGVRGVQNAWVPAKLTLPPAPETETGSVKAWSEAVTLRTYSPMPPDTNPMFLENRVYQGSSGKVYPLPVIDAVAKEANEQRWDAIHLENEYVRLMVLPQVGGRIHVGLDKRNGYDFFYRQNVIKPALVGLAGPWISGGVEFNWPQHHRPATYMPVEVEVERESDGSVIVWCSDHDPMARMKGMHGICLRPDSTRIEVRVRLYNRTMDTQTFLWWANVGVHVHEQYQSFFPRDVRQVADHAKRAIASYPLVESQYYGVDYGDRARNGVPPEQAPSHFVPDGSYPANDLGWYANIPVPTSYMIAGSRGDFAGGYDHKREAGFVSVANHHIAPGKKQWTWGNHDFGYAWDRSLTDSDGPYIELMAGAYTDNQPDFSFLAPGETKTFYQYWYPIREIGVPDIANLDAALRVERSFEEAVFHVEVTKPCPGSSLLIRQAGRILASWKGDLSPDQPLRFRCETAEDIQTLETTLEQAGEVLLRHCPADVVPAPDLTAASEPALPSEVPTLDELVFIGLHLEQYRHPTYHPEDYWLEGLRRDPRDYRCSQFMGRWHLRRGEFLKAEDCLRRAVARSTQWNPNPYDGEAYYNLGLCLLYQESFDDAYTSFYKATWNAAWHGPAYHRLAELDCKARRWKQAQDHLQRSLRADADNLNARNLLTVAMIRLGQQSEAAGFLRATRELDSLDVFSRFLPNGKAPTDGQLRLDLFFDLERAGLREEALAALGDAAPPALDGTRPLLHYARAGLLLSMGRGTEAQAEYALAAAAPTEYVFPSRLEEYVLLEKAFRHNPLDAHAPYYLGNFLYDRRRHLEAIEYWEKSLALDAGLATVWRNIGFGYFNILDKPDAARASFQRARSAAPDDARILFEYDQLLKRTGTPLAERLSLLQADQRLVQRRDDVSLEMASLLTSTDEPAAALELILCRHWQPWEGGEGQVLAEHTRALLSLAHGALSTGDFAAARRFLQQCKNPPESLGEARHLLANTSLIDYWMGVTEDEAGERENAEKYWRRAAASQGDFQQMQTQPISDQSFWSALSMEKLGQIVEAGKLLDKIAKHADQLLETPARIDYFATSLPSMLLFKQDLREKQNQLSELLSAQTRLANQHSVREGLSILDRLLESDASHSGAIDLLRLFRE